LLEQKKKVGYSLIGPKDRNGEFQTQLFAVYQCHTGWPEEAFKAIYPKDDV
jgi:putative transposase